jgi:hypothetical protein
MIRCILAEGIQSAGTASAGIDGFGMLAPAASEIWSSAFSIAPSVEGPISPSAPFLPMS